MSLVTLAGRYQVSERIATGGMGEVYRAHDSVLGREVAVKVLHRTLAGDAGFLDAFRREARSAALLNHTNIVAVYDWGEAGDTSYMVMELVDGRNLRDVLTSVGRLKPAQAATVMLQTLSALEHAHSQGIVHRDIKPENILLTSTGQVKVADFGLARAYAEARITQAPGTVTGTVQYLAPEQIQGEPADPRTDLYSLGVVGYELLTGSPPYSGETSVAVAYKHVQERIPAPSRADASIPRDLDRTVLWATEKDREDRPGSASELRRELASTASALPPAEPLADLVKTVPRIDLPLEHARTVTIPRAEVSPRGGRKRARPGRWRRRLLKSFVGLLVLSGAAFAAWWFLVPVKVPSVIGLSPTAAERVLSSAGLGHSLGAPVYSATAAKGTVALESPAAGAKERRGTSIRLQVSLGPQTVTVPKVVGSTEAAAEAALTAEGLRWKLLPSLYSPIVALGEVMTQSPAKGTKARSGDTVNLTISLGPQPVAVQNVSGKTQVEATAILKGLGFRVAPTQKFSTTVKRGEVISTIPKPGTTLHQGDLVTIVVSEGPKTFPMPDVKGLSQAAAQTTLKAMGLVVKVSRVPGSTGSTVVGQTPSTGSIVSNGATVTIYIGG